MDIFDAISTFGETYSDIKNNMGKGRDHIEVLTSSFKKSKDKIDKQYKKDMKKYNKKGKW